MPKYKEFVNLMLKENEELFKEFRRLHDLYTLDRDTHQEEFNKVGKQVQQIMRKYEDRLCGHSEGTGYAMYSGNLAEKFEQEVRKLFPKIDSVGIVITKKPSFGIKKISF